MKSETLKLIAELCGDDISSKVIVTDEELNIIYTSRPLIFDRLSKDMFSRSNVISDSVGIFPLERKTLLSLSVNNISYIAIIRPYREDGVLYYIIEALDCYDFYAIEQLSQSSLSEMTRLSRLREAASLIYAAHLTIKEQAEREGFENRRAMEMFDKSCYLILAATANKSELQYYTQNTAEGKPADISQITEDICTLCRMYLSRKGIELISDNIEKKIIASFDCDRYVVALLNLIVNSALYNISEKKRIDVSLKRSGDEVRISVRDNGLGMSLEEIEKAFIPCALCRPDSSGGGLGLPIAGLFAKAFGGSASIVSKPDIGTTVTIRLPVHGGRSIELNSPINRYIGDRFSAISVYLSQIDAN